MLLFDNLELVQSIPRSSPACHVSFTFTQVVQEMGVMPSVVFMDLAAVDEK